jgi:hypothetical protein
MIQATIKAKQFIDATQEAQMKAGWDLLEKILDITEPNIPVDTGRMKSSGTVQKVVNQLMAGYNTEYAWLNHQGLSRNGNKIERASGKDRWLARTIEANRTQLLDFFNQRLEKHLQDIWQ